jgi:hypothetical protein
MKMFRFIIAVWAATPWMALTAESTPTPDSVRVSDLRSTDSDVIIISMRAFIPNTHPTNPGYIHPVPGEPQKRMIFGPFRGLVDSVLPAWVRNLAPEFRTAGTDCYLTDNRGFSADDTALSKSWTQFAIVVKSGKVTVAPSDGRTAHRAGPSARIDCSTGNVIAEKLGSFGAPFGVRALSQPAVADGKIQITGQCATGNPHIRSPMIDYSFDLIYDVATKKLNYTVSFGAFPAFEFYASREGGKPVPIITEWPKAASAWELSDTGLGLLMTKRTDSIDLSTPVRDPSIRVPRTQLVGEWIAGAEGKKYKWIFIDNDSKCELWSQDPGTPWTIAAPPTRWELLGNSVFVDFGSVGLFFRIQGNLLVQDRSARVYVKQE